MKYSFDPGKLNLTLSTGELTSANERVLASSIAGAWYPGNASELDNAIKQAMAKIPENSGETPNILILPHAGYQFSLPSAAYGVKSIMDASFDRVILLAPSHRVHLANQLAAPEAAAVSTPYGVIKIDHAAINKLKKYFDTLESDHFHTTEHATQILYPLLQYALKDFQLVPLLVGAMNNQSLDAAAQALQKIITPKTLLLISSDFTHYGANFDFTPFSGNIRKQIEKLDLGAFNFIQKVDSDGFQRYIEATSATICGRFPLALMLKTVPENTVFKLLDYRTSADESGDFSHVVSYLTASGYADWPELNNSDEVALSNAEKQSLLAIARSSIKNVLDGHHPYPANHFAAEASGNMLIKMGCFVTLNTSKNHQLRGCIGEIQPSRPLYQAVTARAVDAAFRDPRFPALSATEFDQITIEISALTPERPVESWRDIIIGKHGMTLSKYGHSAVFLPQVAPEQNWDLPTTLTHLALKAGLCPNDWREGANFTVFEAIVFGEDDFK